MMGGYRWIAWLTCRHDGMTHAVSHEDLRSGIQLRTHGYRSLCGLNVIPHSDVKPVGPFCAQCRAFLGPSALATAHRASVYRPPWVLSAQSSPARRRSPSGEEQRHSDSAELPDSAQS